MNEVLKSECIGTELVPGVEECSGRSEELSKLLGQSACGSCLVLCVEELRDNLEENQLLKDKLYKLKKDEPTGLLTRVSLTEHFDKFRSDADPFAVFFLDVSEFSEYNTNYGHKGGDTILSSIGHALRTNLRSGDTTYLVDQGQEEIDGIASRRGGDEFVLLIKLNSKKEHQDTLERRANSHKALYDQARDLNKRLNLELGGWIDNSLKIVQADVLEEKRIQTSVGFHIGFEISEEGDARTLEDLIDEADPDKNKFEYKKIAFGQAE